MKRFIFTFAKMAISLAILAYLVWDATQSKEHSNVFADMLEQPKHWGLLAAAWCLVFTASTLTLVRWCYLVRAVGIALRLRDALRIGFLAALFNLAPMGIFGGDLLKAMMLAHENPGFRAKALASVIIDRVVGLFVLFVFASVAILATGFYQAEGPAEVRVICQSVVLLTLVGAVGVALLLATPLIESAWLTALGRLPLVGRGLAGLLEAARMYRRDRMVLLLTAAMSVAVHGLCVVCIYLVARGLPGKVLPLETFLVIYPVSAVANTVPLPAGPFEATFNFLYSHVTSDWTILKGQGLVVALVYRLLTILVAAVGFCYYLGARRELADLKED